MNPCAPHLRTAALAACLLIAARLTADAQLPDDGVVAVNVLNAYSRPASGEEASGQGWIVVGAPAFKLGAGDAACCRYQDGFTRNDSLEHVTVEIEASRAFSADIGIYSNHGEFVDRMAFRVPASEFQKLPPGSRNHTRVLRVAWDNRTSDHRLAGTGAYVFKTAVTLERAPGLGELVRRDYRIVGLLRSL